MSTIDFVVPLLLIGLCVLAVLAILGVRSEAEASKNPIVKRALPTIEEVYAAIEPLLYAAIFKAQKASEQFFTDTGKKLDGLDKKAIADSFYAAIPSNLPIAIDGITVNVPLGRLKGLFSQSLFEQWVQEAYDKLMIDYHASADHIDSLFDDLKKQLAYYDTFKTITGTKALAPASTTDMPPAQNPSA